MSKIRVNPDKARAAQNRRIDAQRAAAFREEADPLYFEQARGDISRSVWLKKVAEIKARYPKV